MMEIANATIPPPPAKRHSRHHWKSQFSLRTLLIFVTVICVMWGLIAIWYHFQEVEHQRQAEIAHQLEKLGVRVTWEQQPPSWLNWAGNWRVFDRVQGTWINSLEATNCSLIFDLLDELPMVTSIAICRSQFREDYIPRLARLKQLKILILFDHVLIWDPNAPKSQAELKAVSDKLPSVLVFPFAISG